MAGVESISEDAPLLPPQQQQVVTTDDLDLEEAAAIENFAALDTGSPTTTSRNSGSKQRAAARPSFRLQHLSEVLGNKDALAAPTTTNSTSSSLSGIARFQKATRRVQLMNQMARMKSKRNIAGKKNPNHASNLLKSIDESKKNHGLLSSSDELFAAAGILDSPKNDNDDDDETTNHDDDNINLNGKKSYGSLRFGRKKAKSLTSRWKLLRYLRPAFLWTLLYRNVIRTSLVMIALPAAILAWILYYYLGNPYLNFMPGHASLAWWLDFAARNVCTWQLAVWTQSLILDAVVLGTRVATRLFGPLVTMTALQSRGFPFLLQAWAAWNLLVLHGHNVNQVHWLHWTGWAIYTQENSGSYILETNNHLRLLLALMLTGFAVTVKRMVIGVRFGRSMLAQFKPRMESLLVDIVLMSEIADLAEEAEFMAILGGGGNATADLFPKLNALPSVPAPDPLRTTTRSKGWTKDVSFENVMHAASAAEDDDQGDEDDEAAASSPPSRRSLTKSRETLELKRSTSGRIMLKDQLEEWTEPVNVLDKSPEATLHDVLKFKRALEYMDENSPFGDAFGPASDRNECIESSHAVYKRLLKLTGDSSAETLNFDVLSVVATDEADGTQDESKLKALRHLFQPDGNNELSLLAFVQSCDAVYKKIRYFRASVNNSSAIDLALENLVNGIFWFVLSIVILSVLHLNPWPMLVSITSLLVSVSFALGSSVSKYVEGMLLIAVRRPYDLGDRIIIEKSDDPDSPGSGASWYVEDITLFSTKLRFAKTNEVSTLNNFSISQARIVNLQKSSNAVVNLKVHLHEAVLDNGQIEVFRKELELYARKHPRAWEGLAWFAQTAYDSQLEQVTFAIQFRHRLSWQHAGRVWEHHAQLLRYITRTSKKMGIQYKQPPVKRLLYEGGDYDPNELLTNQKRNKPAADGAAGEAGSLG